MSASEDTGTKWEAVTTPWDVIGTTPWDHPIPVDEDAESPRIDDDDLPWDSMNADSMSATGQISSKRYGTEEAEEGFDANSEEEFPEGEEFSFLDAPSNDNQQENIGYHRKAYIQSLAASFSPDVSSQGSIEGRDPACPERIKAKVEELYAPIWRKNRVTKYDLDTKLWDFKIWKEEAQNHSITGAEGTMPASVECFEDESSIIVADQQ